MSHVVLAKYGIWTYTVLAVNNSLLKACEKRNVVQCIYGKLEWNTSALTLILLTCRIWWANNASRWQIGFNSTFKGLIAMWMLFQCGCWCWSLRKWRCAQRSCSVCNGNTGHGWYHYCSKKSGEKLSRLSHCFNKNKVIAVKPVLWWR